MITATEITKTIRETDGTEHDVTFRLGDRVQAADTGSMLRLDSYFTGRCLFAKVLRLQPEHVSSLVIQWYDIWGPAGYTFSLRPSDVRHYTGTVTEQDLPDPRQFDQPIQGHWTGLRRAELHCFIPPIGGWVYWARTARAVDGEGRYEDERITVTRRAEDSYELEARPAPPVGMYAS